MQLTQEIQSQLDKCLDKKTKKEYENKLTENELTREENSYSHFCVYFVPYDPQNKKILIGDHKKSGLWLMPGGHIEKGENILTSLNREIKEELGIDHFFTQKPEPFLLTITNIKNDVRLCQKHFDLWHLMITDVSHLKIDYTEYHQVKWLTIPEAKRKIIDPASQQALKVLEKITPQKTAQ